MSNEPLHDIAHLGGVELFTPQPDKSLWYFRDLLGMEVVHTAGASVHLRGYGDHAASTLKLTAASAPGVGCIAWRTTSPAALERRAAALAVAGLGVGWTNGDFGRGRSFRFRDPDGHLMEIYYEEQKYAAPAELRSSLQEPAAEIHRPRRGRAPPRPPRPLASDVATNRRFAQELLGFQLREQVIFDHGTKEIGAWSSPNALHHQLAYVIDVKGGRGRLHHFSLWIDNREDVLRAADILSENGIFIEAGPAKHNNSQGFYLYSWSPAATGWKSIPAPTWCWRPTGSQ